MSSSQNSNGDRGRPADPNATRILTTPLSLQPTVILPQGSALPPTRQMSTGVPNAATTATQGATQILPRADLGTNAPAFDPVVGWLVVVGGPGLGNSLNVRYGQNSIGRGSDQRIVVDFGDQRISRETHAIIVYEDRTRKFYLRDTGQSNLVYLGPNVVLQPVELKDRDLISIGDSVLMFIALCDEKFDWLAGLAANAQSKP